MRKIFFGDTELTEDIIRKEMRSAFKAAGVPNAPVIFVDSLVGITFDDCIEIPRPSYVRECEGENDDTFNWRFWCLVFHEAAHWIDQYTNEHSADHCAKMYIILIALVLERHLPLDVFWKGESSYKYGSLKRGMTGAARYILERSPVNPETRGYSGDTRSRPTETVIIGGSNA